MTFLLKYKAAHSHLLNCTLRTPVLQSRGLTSPEHSSPCSWPHPFGNPFCLQPFFFWQTGFYNPSFKDSVNPFLNFAINFHISPFLFQYWHASLSEIEFISGNWPFIKRFQYRVNWQTLTYLGNQIFTLFSQHRHLPEVNSAGLYAIIICHISVHI